MTRGPAVIGLTGGIASGKSTVAGRLRVRHGIDVIDADQIARDVVEPGEPALEAIRQTFGEQVILPDGRLDRAALGAIVFRDREALSQLNALTHPAIKARVGALLDELQRLGKPWVVYEAALIIENALSSEIDGLIVVICEPEAQLKRIVERDGLSEEDALARIRAQTDNATRRRAASWVIDNDGSKDVLQARTDALVTQLEERFRR